MALMLKKDKIQSGKVSARHISDMYLGTLVIATCLMRHACQAGKSQSEVSLEMHIR